MSNVILIALVALGLAALAVRRPAAAVIVIAGQTLLVGAGALGATSGRSGEFLVAALLLDGPGRGRSAPSRSWWWRACARTGPTTTFTGPWCACPGRSPSCWR